MNTSRSFRFAFVFAATAAFSLVAGPALSATRIGLAAQIQNQVSAILGGDTRTLRLGNDVFAGERIRTGQSSNAQLTFLDQTNLTIGSQSDVVLDKFVFDPNKGAGDVVMTTTAGALRFISGSQNPNTYKVNTPAATIAIRGTLAYSFIFGGTQYIVNGYGHVEATLKPPGVTPPVVIPPGMALVIINTPNGPKYELIKWQLGLLDLDRLAQLLPQFEELPDGLKDLVDQYNATNQGEHCDCCDCSNYRVGPRL